MRIMAKKLENGKVHEVCVHDVDRPDLLGKGYHDKEDLLARVAYERVEPAPPEPEKPAPPLDGPQPSIPAELEPERPTVVAPEGVVVVDAANTGGAEGEEGAGNVKIYGVPGAAAVVPEPDDAPRPEPTKKKKRGRPAKKKRKS